MKHIANGFEHIANGFAALLKPIIETVGRFGLKVATFTDTESQWPTSMKRWLSATIRPSQSLATGEGSRNIGSRTPTALPGTIGA
jgi:hypothetical protein